MMSTNSTTAIATTITTTPVPTASTIDYANTRTVNLDTTRRPSGGTFLNAETTDGPVLQGRDNDGGPDSQRPPRRRRLARTIASGNTIAMSITEMDRSTIPAGTIQPCDPWAPIRISTRPSGIDRGTRCQALYRSGISLSRVQGDGLGSDRVATP